MTQKYIAEPLGLINPGNLGANEKLLLSISYEMFPDKKVGLYKKDNYLIVHTTYWSKLKKIWRFDQDEFPTESLPWIVDRFENGFLKSQNQGGLSNFERSQMKEFNGELIGINAMVHCCAENLPGFNIWNANRANYISQIPPQQWDIPSYMLQEQDLLSQLKSLAEDFENGRL